MLQLVLFAQAVAGAALPAPAPPTAPSPTATERTLIALPHDARGIPVDITDQIEPDRADIGLERALVLAYETNPTLLADREGLKVLDNDVATARSAGRPNLAAEASLTRSEFDVRGTGYVAGLRLQQPLFRAGRIKNNIRSAETNVLAGRETLRRTEMGILTAVIEAYSAVLRDREVLLLRYELVRDLQTIAEGQQDLVDAREGIYPDVSRARARVEDAQSAARRAELSLRSSELALKQLTGVYPGHLTQLPPLPLMPRDADDAVFFALEASPEVKQARYARQIAEFQRRVVNANRMPTIDFNGTVQRRNEVVQFLGREFNQTLGTFVVTMSVPIYQGGAEYAAIRRAKNVVAVRDLEILEAERQTEFDVRVAWSQLARSVGSYEALQQSASENLASLSGLRRILQVSGGTILPVLDAKNEYSAAQIGAVQQRHEAYVAGVALLATIGALTPEALGMDVTLYDPNDHYQRVADKWIGTEP